MRAERDTSSRRNESFTWLSIFKPDCGALIVDERRDEFAAAVVRVLTDKALHRTLSEQGVACAREWSSRAMAHRLAGLYRQIVSERHSEATTATPPRAASSPIGH